MDQLWQIFEFLETFKESLIENTNPSKQIYNKKNNKK
jgi:hypothetical protein